MSPIGDITIYESQLLRTYGAPVTVDRIRNLDYRPTYSYGLAWTISMNSLMQAWLSWLPSRTFIVKIPHPYNNFHIYF